jgi:cytochrome c2
VPQGDVQNGKTLFQQKCGGCHTLADAGTKGQVGPNLDQAFAAMRSPSAKAQENNFQEDTIREVVGDQIKFPGEFQPPQAMPANLVTGSDVADVASYVARFAGTGVGAAAARTATAAPSGAAPAGPAPGGGAGGTSTTGGGGGSAAQGQQLYSSLGCSGCHTIDGTKSTGPSFKGLAGSKVDLTDGKTVTADDVYLLRSIEDPDAEIVKGFAPGIMSSAIKKGQVSKGDAEALVAYLKTLK